MQLDINSSENEPWHINSITIFEHLPYRRVGMVTGFVLIWNYVSSGQ